MGESQVNTNITYCETTHRKSDRIVELEAEVERYKQWAAKQLMCLVGHDHLVVPWDANKQKATDETPIEN